MKKAISGIVLGLFLLAGSTAHAQMMPQFGVKGGLNYSTFNNTENTEYKAGALAGVFANFKVPNSPMAVQPEVLYAQYGSNFEDTDAKLSIDYIQIPVLAKFAFGPSESTVVPEVFFGPYAGFKVNSEVEGDEFTVETDDFFESTDFGVAVGAGVNISQVSLEFRYTAGLTNVVANSTFEDNQKNGAFSLTAGISF
ncbi:porin family protein [Gracilimonas mengyeensis]|uniref:Outer membrane protein beta-barrel domain-containing protein n=1 Tax=Gracilimonas mengyeensis TaxID=1302730 RepID=A0A521CGK3_9BACT|nr:porin family protein [Gracilimonas mengyeensis]SMO58549.1 Outer membrane protein beta-barrel domain-containing protein [Gracilimonas mengyeensis]